MANQVINVKIEGDETNNSGVTTVGATTNIKLQKGTVILNKSDSFRSVSYASPENLSANPERVLRQLRESLRTLFGSQGAWFVPFHWISSNKYEAENYFVRLDLDELNLNGTQIKRTNAQYEDLFLPSVSSLNASLRLTISGGPRRILLQGDAGYGKTTLCVKIAHEWSTDADSVLQKFKLVLLFRLRNVETSLDRCVLEFCSKMTSSKIDERLLVDIITDLGSELLLILDGLDEVSEERLAEIRDVLCFHDTPEVQPSFLRNCTFLFTTRPNTIDQSFTMFIDRNARIRSLTTPDAFLSTYFNSETSVREVKEKLEGIKFSSQWSPLLLYIVCYLYENGELSDFDSEDQLLRAILRLLSIRCMYRENLSYYEYEQWDLFLKLGEVFLECLMSNRYYVHETDLQSAFGDDSSFIEKCGVLKRPPSFEIREKRSYEPIHKVFVEFLAIAYLNHQCTILSGEEKRNFVSSLLLKCYRSEYTVRVLDLGGDTDYTTLLSPVINRVVTVKIQTYKLGDDSEPKVEFANHRKYAEILKLLESTQPVQTDTLIGIKHKGQVAYLPPQFRQGLHYFLSSYKHETFVAWCARYKKYDPFRVKLNIVIHRRCLCSLEHTKLPLDLANYKSKFFPYISNFKFSQNDVECEQCQFYYQPLADMLLRSCSMVATLIGTCPMKYLIENPDLIRSVISNDCSLCGIFPGVTRENAGNEFLGLQPVLSLFLQHALKCAEYAIHIGSFTELGTFMRHLIRCITTTQLETPVTVSVNKGNLKCTMIPNKSTNTINFFCLNGQSREPMLQSGNSSVVTRFVSLIGPNMLKNGLFKVSLTVTELSTFLLIEWIDNCEDQTLHETSKIKFQILRNKAVNPAKAAGQLLKSNSKPGLFDIL